MKNTLTFYKYQGTGNDFVMIDNRQHLLKHSDVKTINHLCDRRFGVGADGLILLENSETTDFKMVYFNADGNQSTMCGNGGRCIVAFAYFLKLFTKKTTFEAIDGWHHATINGVEVNLQMQNVDTVTEFKNHVFLDTGSPHHVQFESDIDALDVKVVGRQVRNDIYGTEGSNVNFVQKINDSTYKMRTYERGVEDETLACGTGATAVAIAMYHQKTTTATNLKMLVEGGELEVSFQEENGFYTDIYLKGKAIQVFKGEIKC